VETFIVPPVTHTDHMVRLSTSGGVRCSLVVRMNLSCSRG
jgi:hypothetical protein